ncbi:MULTISPECIES: Holliday junction resolvase RuvX [Rhodomicrobium]|uniref:Holliday junction resolvase RuvX n=1 Tax=Rhodomicrobium sp. R_RK_3 TaxID=2029567 RepID=UPI001FD98500|nr:MULTISPECIES: Holliday junction resolvase RuvX [Rhodomicrobium]
MRPDFSIEALAAALPRQGAVFGLDVGTKTIGVAISDVTRTVATAVKTIRRKKFSADMAELFALAAERGAIGYVIGLPINFNASEGPRAQACRAFARNLAGLTSAPIALWDERLSTAAAERAMIEADASRKRRAEVIDAVAAAYILQGALDRMKGLDYGPKENER